MPINTIDRWDGATYSRILLINDRSAKLEISRAGEKQIRVQVQAENDQLPEKVKPQITGLVEGLLGLRQDLRPFYALADQDRRIRTLKDRFLGLKPPRFPSVFEALVNAIACQQLSLSVGITVLNRLAKAFGRAWQDDSEELHAFPTPEDLSAATPTSLRSLGFSYHKAGALISLARGLRDRTIDFSGIEALSDDDALAALLGLKGVGRWSGEYALLRGLGRLEIFPGDDVGAQNNLETLFRLRTKPDYEKIRSLTRRWAPFAGLVYFHLLLNKLQAKGYLK